MIQDKIKERLIGIILLLFGLQYTITGVYHTINFDSLHSITLSCLVPPSPTDYYIPITILGVVCIISGILIYKEKKGKTYISNVALVGIAIDFLSKIFYFGVFYFGVFYIFSYINSIIWTIIGIAFSVIALKFLNQQDFQNKKQIIIKIFIVILGLTLIYLAPEYYK